MANESLSAKTKRLTSYRLEDETLTPEMIAAGAHLLDGVIDRDGLAARVYTAMRSARPKYSAVDLKRFFEKFVPGPEDDCWTWTGAVKAGWGGYGKFYYQGKLIGAHVAAWEIANRKTVPKRWVVCHTCDNPPCVNPLHLFPGTFRDNMIDMWTKGRARPNGMNAKGSRNPQSVFKEADIPVIRQMISDGTTQTAIAKQFGVTVQAVNRIHRGRAWTHVVDFENGICDISQDIGSE